MTAYLAGLALLRCAEHERAAEIDSTSRLTLAAMATFVSKDREQAGDPLCYASQSTIGARCGLHRTVVHKATRRLGTLGLIERVETQRGVPVHWRLAVLARSGPVAESDTSTTGDLSLSATPPVAQNDTPCSAEQHNPSDSSRPPGREGGGRSDAADADASAGATATAAAPSTGEGTLVAEVRDARGCSAESAERWIERKIAAATGPVRNENAFIRKCLTAEAEQRTDTAERPASTPRPAKAGKTSTAKAKKPRRRASVPEAEQRDAIAASRAGEDHDAIADRMNVRRDRVDFWRKSADRTDAYAAVDEGQSDELVAARFGQTVENLRGHRYGRCRSAALAALRGGATIDQVATDAADAFGEPVTVETVREWAGRARPSIPLPPPAPTPARDEYAAWRAEVFAA